MGYVYILGCIFFTVYGQLAIKWGMSNQPALPNDIIEKCVFLVKLIVFNPWVFSGFFSAFLASLFWMSAMTKFSLSYAYPFMSLAYVFVLVFSVLAFGEVLNTYKVLGTSIIILGVVVLSRGY